MRPLATFMSDLRTMMETSYEDAADRLAVLRRDLMEAEEQGLSIPDDVWLSICGDMRLTMLIAVVCAADTIHKSGSAGWNTL